MVVYEYFKVGAFNSENVRITNLSFFIRVFIQLFIYLRNYFTG